MASETLKNTEQTVPEMNGNERRFWCEAFLAAVLPALFRKLFLLFSPIGTTHIAADFADAALTEYRRRFGESR